MDSNDGFGLLGLPDMLAEGSKRWGILIIGDSQCAGKAQVVVGLTPTNDPGFAFSAVQATTYVKLYRNVAEAAGDPPTFNITATNVAVQPYTGVGSVVFGGPDIGIGQILTKWRIPAVITNYSIVGLACKQMTPTPSPMYPTGGPSWHTTMVAYQRNVELVEKVKTKIIVVSSSNNDGFNATDSGNLVTNIPAQYAGLQAAFPGAVIVWIKIHSDTINVGGYRADTYTNQQTGLVAAGARQIWVDDQPPVIGIQIDHAHLTANGEYVFASRAFWAAYDLLGYARPRTAGAPILCGDAPMTATDGAGAPTSDGSPIAGAGEVLVVLDMLVGGAFSAQATPSGWVAHSNATFNTGSGVGCRLLLYTRAVDSTMLNANHGNTAVTSVALTAPSTRLFCKILTFLGSNPASPPTLVQAVYNGVALNSSSYTGPSITVGSGSRRRVVVITVGFVASSLQTTVTLTGLTGGAVERNSMCVTPGTAGGLIDVQSADVAASTTINITNVATNHALTGPVTVAFEMAS